MSTLSSKIENTVNEQLMNTIEKRFEIKQKDAINKNVEYQFPVSTPTVRQFLEKSYYQRQKLDGRTTGVRGIDSFRTKGRITQADMIRLETLKRNCFLDYNSVEKYLQNNKLKSQGIDCDPVKTVSLTNKTYLIDDVTSPLSCSLIID